MTSWNRIIAPLLLLTANGGAATFEDPVAGFAIDLPDGYAEQSRQEPPGVTVLTFAREDGLSIVVSALSFDAGHQGTDEVFDLTLKHVEDVVGGPTEARELNEMDVGGLPARWGWVERRDSDGTAIIAGIGVIELDDQFVNLTVFTPEAGFATLRPQIEAAFFSIRTYGDQAGEVTNVIAIDRGSKPPAILEPSTYRHPLFTVDLPAGWEGKTVSTEAKSINLASLSDGGNTITVMCMSGLLASRKVIEDVMQTTMSSNMPNNTVRGTNKITAANGKPAYFTVYEGSADAQGSTVAIHGVTAALKHRKCQLGFIAVGPATADARGVDAIMRIIQSVR